MTSANQTDDVLHGFSVDVEDWFHILDCEGSPDTSAWKSLEERVVASTTRFLDLLDVHGHKATFFVLGWVAEQHPELIAEIAHRGHEVGSHSYAHRMVHSLSVDDFAKDLDRSLTTITAATGKDVHAFRAPGFSIGENEVWAFKVLAQRGIKLDASLFLAPRAHGGFSLQRDGPFELVLDNGDRLTEVPIIPWSPPLSLNSKISLPYSGGGYLRLLPTAMLCGLFGQADRNGRPVVTYMHPRELDPDQPRMELPPWRAFKYYVGLNSVHDKLDKLFSRFRFGTLSEVANHVTLDAPLHLPLTA